MLEGPLLRLRRADKSDIPELSRWFLDSELCTYLSGSPLDSPEETQKRLSMLIPGMGTYNEDMYMVFEDKEGGKVGFCVLQEIDWKNHSLMYNLAIANAEDRGRNLGAHMLVLSYRFIFHELGMHTAVNQVHGFNKRMIRLAEAFLSLAGNQPAGRLRQHVVRGGRYHDSIIYCITREEFEVITRHPDFKAYL